MSLLLEQTLSSILQSLANFFGVTTQTIMENAPMWLAKYGWYTTAKDIGINILLASLFGGAIIAMLWLLIYLLLEVDYKPGHTALFVIVGILVFCIIVVVPIISCAIAPEYAGIEALLELVNN